MEETQKTYLSRLGGKHRLTYLKLAGSIIVILSGFIPFADNIISWAHPEFDKMLDARGVLLRSDIWIESLYLSIVLCSIGRIMRAYNLCYYFPIYAACYSLVMYELMRFGYEINPDWSHRIGFLMMLIPGFYVIFRLNKYIKKLKFRDVVIVDSIEEYTNENPR
ncbi:hypothetical protein [Chryseobacterium indologenes]|uniref:hypothetical protein n=1 Tax=Chryseobacterium indologenes TaxID=253 RepID=UPI003D3295D6